MFEGCQVPLKERGTPASCQCSASLQGISPPSQIKATEDEKWLGKDVFVFSLESAVMLLQTLPSMFNGMEPHQCSPD